MFGKAKSGGRVIAWLALVISVLAFALSLIAFQRTGGEVSTVRLIKEVGRLRQRMDKLRSQTADLLDKSQKAIRPEEKK